MSRYFFDVNNGDRLVSDRTGMDLKDEAHAIHEATLIIDQLTQDADWNKRRSTILVSIRNEDGASLYDASTSFVED